MEVILINRVEYLGAANTVVNVKPGYARNYLIPQGLAVIANATNKEALAEQIKAQDANLEAQLVEYRAMATKLGENTIRIAAKAGTSGKIFGSVTTVQIALAIKEQFSFDVERQNISIPVEVKELGTYKANVALHKEVKFEISFEVYEDK